MEISARISNYISKNGIIKKFIAKKSSIPVNALSLSLNGKRKLSVDEYVRLCDALNVTYDFFIKDANPSDPLPPS